MQRGRGCPHREDCMQRLVAGSSMNTAHMRALQPLMMVQARGIRNQMQVERTGRRGLNVWQKSFWLLTA